jgi:hypothetical protein
MVGQLSLVTPAGRDDLDALDDLRTRRIAASYGLDEAPVTRSPDDADFQKLIDSRIRAHSAAEDEKLRNIIDARIERRV